GPRLLLPLRAVPGPRRALSAPRAPLRPARRPAGLTRGRRRQGKAAARRKPTRGRQAIVPAPEASALAPPGPDPRPRGAARAAAGDRRRAVAGASGRRVSRLGALGLGSPARAVGRILVAAVAGGDRRARLARQLRRPLARRP